MVNTFSFDDVASGQIFQLGIVVPDVDVSVRIHAEALQIGPFTCSRGFKAPEGWYRGSADMPELTIAHAYAGRLFIELIQQHDDVPSIYTEYTKKYGYGFHHFGIAVATEDYDETLEKYYSLGFENVFTDQLPGGVRIRYLGPKTEEARDKLRNETGVCYFECVEWRDSNKAFFGGMYQAYLNWDGKTLFRER